jgi:hypothetical protein
MTEDRRKMRKHPGRGGNNVSLYPLTADQAVRGMFQIAPEDVKRILAKRPGKKKR